MIIPSAADVIRAWELGKDRVSWYRAMLMLAPTYPDLPFDDLAEMSIGERNRNLFELRSRLFGDTLHAQVKCPECATIVEFDLEISDVLNMTSGVTFTEEYEAVLEPFVITYRLPNSADLQAMDNVGTKGLNSPDYIRNCLKKVQNRNGETVLENVPEKVIRMVKELISEKSELAELNLDIACSECKHEWLSNFDIVEFLWNEFTLQAKQLLNQVHTLASRYCWREADILAMSAVRRSYYLQLQNDVE